MRSDGRAGPAPDGEPTETAELHISLGESTRPDGRAELRRLSSPMRVIATLAGLIRQLLGRLRL